jgi:hypothetical protein
VVPVAAVAAAAAIAVVTIAAVNQHHGSASGASGPATILGPAAQREHDAAVNWINDVQGAFGPGLTGTVTAMLTGAPDWERGALSSSDFGARVGLAQAQLIGARDRMVALVGFAPSPLVKDLTVRSTELSLEAARTDQAATGLGPGDMRLQRDLEARRLQQLATRIFDRAQVIVQGYLHQPAPAESVEPAEVPSWSAARLAPGPPLDPTGPRNTGQPPTGPPSRRQASRPTEPRAKWLATARSLDIPGGDQVAAALAKADTAALRRLADDLQHASDALGDQPDPRSPGGREESARYRLTLLIRAEAAREGELAVFGGDGGPAALAAGARRLVLLSDGLAPPELVARSSDLDPGLLTAND